MSHSEGIRCLLCNSTQLSIIDEFYYYCPCCEYIFKDKCCHLSETEEADRYRLHNNSLEDAGYTSMLLNFFREAMAPFLPPSPALLDFGSGPNPVFTTLLRQEGFQVDIYDKYFSPTPLFQDRSYDGIILFEVIEHLADPLTTMKILSDLLNPGGVLAVGTLFHPGPGSPFSKWWYRQDKTHIGFFNTKSMNFLADFFQLIIIQSNGKNSITFKKK